MRRRAFLATAGTILTAGCGALTGGNGGDSGGTDGQGLHSGDIGLSGGDIGEDEIDTGEIGNNSNFSDIDIDTSEIGGDINNSEIDTNIDIDLSDDGETATPENQEATRHIAHARESLINAHNTYTSQAEGRRAQIPGIKPTTESFTWVGIRRDVQNALDSLEDAAEYASGGQAVNVLALEQVGYFLLLSAKADAKLIDAYKHFEFSVARLFNESLTQAEIARKEMNDDWREARDIYQELTDKINEQSMVAFSQLNERLYERKIRQLDSGVAAFMDFRDGLKTTQDGVSRAQLGVDAYLSDNYEDAKDEFTRASAEFAVASTSFSFVSNDTGLMPRANEINATVTTMEQASEDLRRSSGGKVDDERLIYFEAKRAAEEHIESNETVKNMPTFRNILF